MAGAAEEGVNQVRSVSPLSATSAYSTYSYEYPGTRTRKRDWVKYMSTSCSRIRTRSLYTLLLSHTPPHPPHPSLYRLTGSGMVSQSARLSTPTISRRTQSVTTAAAGRCSTSCWTTRTPRTLACASAQLISSSRLIRPRGTRATSSSSFRRKSGRPCPLRAASLYVPSFVHQRTSCS